MTNSNAESPLEVLQRLRNTREEDATLDRIHVDNALAALHILAPAALNAASAGNVTMKKAVRQAWPYLQKI